MKKIRILITTLLITLAVAVPNAALAETTVTTDTGEEVTSASVPQPVAEDSTDDTSTGVTIDKDGKLVEDTENTVTVTVNMPTTWYGQKIQILIPQDDGESEELSTVVDAQGSANITIPKDTDATLKFSADAPAATGYEGDEDYTGAQVLAYTGIALIAGLLIMKIIDSRKIKTLKRKAADVTYDEVLDDF